MTKLIVCGLARNCETPVVENLKQIEKCSKFAADENFKILVLENDSTDNTRKVLQSHIQNNPKVELHIEDQVDEKFPLRVERLSYCREKLRKIAIRQSNGQEDQFFIVIDLDSSIGTSLQEDTFAKAVHLLEEHQLNGVFPISKPYYYDVMALRCTGWCEVDTNSAVRADRRRLGTYGSILLNRIAYQKSVDAFVEKSIIPVKSAFNGFGVYRLTALMEHSYSCWDGDFRVPVCEHVPFNKRIGKLAISTELVIDAPEEHLRIHLRGKRWILKKRISWAIRDFLRTFCAKE